MRLLRLCLVFCAGLTGTVALAQTESTLYFMTSIPQSMEANPAFIPRYKTVIGLPGLSSMAAVYSNNGFTYDDMTTKVNGVTQADLSKWTSSLAEKNYVQTSLQADLFRIGLRINPKMYFTASSTAITHQRAMIPKGLATLFVDGTAPLVGTYSNTSPQADQNSIISTNIGLAYQANEKLTIGGRLKFLVGQSNVSTENSSLIVQVGNDYQISATGSALVRTSGIQEMKTPGYDAASHWTNYLKNNGWGLDLGATYKFMDKLIVSASLTDIGFITWRNNTYQYTLDPAKANYTFSGFDLNQLVNHNQNYLNAQLDSLKKKFTMTESPIGSYSTSLPGKFYLSANYELVKDLKLGVLFFGQNFRDQTSTGMTAALSKNFGKLVSSTVSYTVSNRSYNNLGLGVSFNMSPVQIYFVGDNLLGAPASLISEQTLNSYINSAQLLTLRAGINIVLGLDKGLTKKETVADKSHNPKSNTSKAKVKTTFGRSPQRKKKK
ncbi:MAG TPA: DUF5723 family protein [Cyclobacteriaceae bacterium]|nr:DUF5723 family protein [Cyclobacteriaceae bacterium]